MTIKTANLKKDSSDHPDADICDDPTILSDDDTVTDSMPPPEQRKGMRAVSDFAVMEKLGQGGMGTVYAAREKKLARNVAVKRLNNLLAGDEKQRYGFKAEATITGKLAHPNIIPIYSIIDEKDNLAIAMKLIEGRTLQDILHPVSEVDETYAAQYDLVRKLEIVDAVCNAVRFAHSRDIVHRDIKPGNVMVGEFGEILLLDWGLAISVSKDPESATAEGIRHKTGIRGIEGTMFYMPPEMLTIEVAAIGIRSDVYLLGGLLYEILAGRPPHLERKLKTLAETAQVQPPPLPDTVDSELREICAKALSPSPGDRYPSVRAFQVALLDYLRHGESRAACDAAADLLDQATATLESAALGDGRTHTYDLLAGAVFGFTNALGMWEENDAARKGERRARMLYAETARANGDFGLALLQLDKLTGDDADRLREQIHHEEKESQAAVRAKAIIKRLAVVAIVLIAVTAAMVGVVFWGAAAVGKSTAHKSKARLEAEGQEQIGRIVNNAAAQILAKKQLLDAAILNFVQIALPAERGALSKEDLLAHLAAPTTERRLSDLRAKITPYGMGFVLRLDTPEVTFSFPESSKALVPALKWWEGVETADDVFHTRPALSETTHHLISATVIPIQDDAGNRIGAAAMYSDLQDILSGMSFPATWGEDVKTEVIGLSPPEDGDKVLLYYTLDDDMDGWDSASTDAIPEIPIADPVMAARIRRGDENGTAGVISIARKGVPSFAGFAPLPGTRGQVLLSVPKHALSAMAKEIEDGILEESRTHLHTLGRIVGGIFVGLLLAALVIVRRVR